MHDENYYSSKIRKLQKMKRKAHNKSINSLYKKVGHYFVQTESKKKITKENYSNFTYINKNTLNELREIANNMPHKNGIWKLKVNNVNKFCCWFAKTFRDNQGKISNNNTNYEQNKNSDSYSTNTYKKDVDLLEKLNSDNQ